MLIEGMRVSFTTELKVKIILLMAKHEHPAEVQRILRIDNSRMVPHVNGIKRLFAKFCETGSVHSLPRSGRPKRSEEIKSDENVKPSPLPPQQALPVTSCKVCPKCEEAFNCRSDQLKTMKRFRRRAGKMYEFYKSITGEPGITKDEENNNSEQSDSSSEAASSDNNNSDESDLDEGKTFDEPEAKKKALRVPLALDVKIRIVLLMAKLESPLEVQKTFRREKSSIVPSKNTIYRAFRKFCQTGSVIDQVKRQPRKLNEAKLREAHQSMVQSNQNRAASLAEISNNIGISRTSLFKIRQFFLGKDQAELSKSSIGDQERRMVMQRSPDESMTIKQLSSQRSSSIASESYALPQNIQHKTVDSEPQLFSNLSSTTQIIPFVEQLHQSVLFNNQAIDLSQFPPQEPEALYSNRIESYQSESGAAYAELIQQSDHLSTLDTQHFESLGSLMPLQTIELQPFTSTFTGAAYGGINMRENSFAVENNYSSQGTFPPFQVNQNEFNSATQSGDFFSFDNEFR